MDQIIAALDPHVLDRAALDVHVKRAVTADTLGCNIYGQLENIMSILDRNEMNRSVKVRRELLALLKFFPRRIAHAQQLSS